MSEPEPWPSSTPPTSALAIISLIGGIAGWTLLPFLGSMVGIVCGHMAKNEIKKSGGTIGGNGMATAGLILGYTAIAVGFCIVCLLVLAPLIGLSIPLFNNSSY